MGEMFYSLLVFFMFCVAITYIVTRVEIVVKQLSREKPSIIFTICCIIVFSIPIILTSKYAFMLNDAKTNLRTTIAVMAAIVGGPICGVSVAVIGAAYRMSLGGWTALPCSLATVFAGLLASGVVWKTDFRPSKIGPKAIGLWGIFAAAWEFVHIQIFVPSFGDMKFKEAFDLMFNSLMVPQMVMNSLLTVSVMIILLDIIGNYTRKTKIVEQNDLIEKMLEHMKEVAKFVKTESSSVNEFVLKTQECLSTLSMEIDDVSETTRLMSSGMAETAASSRQITTASAELSKASETIADKAQRCAQSSMAINQRADRFNKSAFDSKETANKTRIQMNEKLRGAIEQSRSIDQISKLSEAILSIASQTNLLALNASIEAARAGESGKGFAVVADEIRKLAEDSKNVVNEIQSITNKVIESVGNLVEGSEQVLNFIDTQVIKDYDEMVETGQEYYKDAETLNDMAADFSSTAQELSASIQNMVNAIEGITHANNDAASGTESIAEKVGVVAQNTNGMRALVRSTKESFDKLMDMIKKFD